MTSTSNTPLPVGKLPFELLGSLLASLATNDPAVVVGPGLGRDAAVLDIAGTKLVIKNDPITFVSRDAGTYLVHVNANDLACLGASPKWMLVTALLPEQSSTPELVAELFEQLRSTCHELGIALIGGHTEVTAGVSRPLLIGTMIGTEGESGLLYPGLASRGDRLVLTRPAGIEGTALLALERPDELTVALGSSVVVSAQGMLDDPGISVVNDARILLKTGAVTSLHDPTEGGVATGIREIATASNLGAVANRDLVPLLTQTIAIADHYHIDPLGMLSSGTLLATVDPARLGEFDRACQEAGIPAVHIGKLTTAESGFQLIEANISHELPIFQTDEVTRALAQ